LRFGYAFGSRHTAYDYLRAQYHLACIAPHLPMEVRSGQQRLSAIEIGPGTGLLALAIKQLLPNSALVLVDLPETFAFSSIFLTMVLPESRFVFLDGFEREPDSWREYDFTLITPEAARRLPSTSFDLAVNTDSMQDMEPTAIRDYFTLLRRLLRPPALFYSSNRVKKWTGPAPPAWRTTRTSRMTTTCSRARMRSCATAGSGRNSTSASLIRGASRDAAVR
jgi:putative sugar O-methyltransferase